MQKIRGALGWWGLLEVRGSQTVEYGLILALVSLVLAVILKKLGTHVEDMFNDIIKLVDKV